MDQFLTNKHVLIIGASSDLAKDINTYFIENKAVVGLHYYKNKKSMEAYSPLENVKLFCQSTQTAPKCYQLIEEYISWAGGIDFLLLLAGDIKESLHWLDLKEEHWEYDLRINLLGPFYLAQAASQYMIQQKVSGRILFTSTSSAVHGGGSFSLSYGASKAALECVVKRLAKDLAPYNILVNGAAPGFMDTKFHTSRMGRSKTDLKKRADAVPLKRAGTITEFGSLAKYLFSEHASYLTGQIIHIDGGDWL